FALSNIGVLNTVNLVATLLPTGGVSSPSGPDTYGVITPAGPAVARPFSFTAGQASGGVVIATLQLQDGAKTLGTVSFSFNLPLVSAYVSTNRITIPDHGSGFPYPS